MAKPKQNKYGVWKLSVAFNYQRKKLTLGKITQVEAEHFAANINLLISYRKHQDGIPPTLQSWVTSLAASHRDQLAGIGLVKQYDLGITVDELVAKFLEHYENRPDIKANTKRAMRQSLTHRIPKFLKAHRVRDLEPMRPDEMPNATATFSPDTESVFQKVNSWQREHYALSSWSRANGRMREVGNWAVARGICKFNPFVIMPTPEQVNETRNEYVPREWVLDVMANCLDADTRLLLALGRFAGLRTPSECRRMKPDHVDWDGLKLTVIGKGRNRPVRVMPLFDNVARELERHRDAVGWSRLVFSDRFMTSTDANNYQLIREAAARAGFDVPWGRLRQNLRASCENDLLEAGFSEREVVAWLGHTVKTSRKSYQKQTTTHLRNAVDKARAIGI